MGTGFVKFPRWLLEEPYLSGLSGNEKILYSLIADRCELSKSTGKCDEDGKPFAVFTIKSIMLAIGCEKATAIKALDKLEGIGLIVRKKKHRQPSSIYLSESSLGSESEPSKVQKLNLLGSEILILAILILDLYQLDLLERLMKKTLQSVQRL